MSERITLQEIPLEELTIVPGSACQGCGPALASRLTFKVLGPNTIRHSVPCCPDAVTRTPGQGTEFEAGGNALTGTWRALKAIGRTDINVVGFFGDGGTYDIGLQALSAAAERNENVFVICKDNEAYMNTGNQRSSSTPLYALTTTTPVGIKSQGKRHTKEKCAHDLCSARYTICSDNIYRIPHRPSCQGSLWQGYPRLQDADNPCSVPNWMALRAQHDHSGCTPSSSDRRLPALRDH